MLSNEVKHHLSFGETQLLSLLLGKAAGNAVIIPISDYITHLQPICRWVTFTTRPTGEAEQAASTIFSSLKNVSASTVTSQ